MCSFWGGNQNSTRSFLFCKQLQLASHLNYRLIRKSKLSLYYQEQGSRATNDGAVRVSAIWAKSQNVHSDTKLLKTLSDKGFRTHIRDWLPVVRYSQSQIYKMPPMEI